MTRFLCIHGHFYQPPRLDPWIEDVLPENGAGPDHDWNARITRQCYAPLGAARRLDSQGLIREMINCYAWMSFNFGPTLLSWMERHAPETYARILAADAESLARWGHGNALAQVYHHPIMPLATELDKTLEVQWAVQDFRQRFGRAPEGMWLAETAVDLPTLETLADAGIAFTILAPRQAASVRRPGEAGFRPVSADTLDTTRPYLVRLSQGKSITVFFYHGPTSQAVAFERLLENGENFWNRLAASFPGGLRNIATDGESYGHHFPFGEMALAYVVDQARQGRDNLALTNYAAYLAAHPAEHEVLLHENTSWSCAHGLERWKTHCGCSGNGHPDWTQDWRRPLRRCLNYLKYYADEHFFRRGAEFFTDPNLALREYGLTLAGTETLESFLDRHGRKKLAGAEKTSACRLLLMQRLALASFASCAWFFDDISGLEPLNALTSARRTLDLLRACGGPDVEDGFVRILSEAQSNVDDKWDGAALWETMINPRRPSLRSLALYFPPGGPHEISWPGLRLRAQTEGPELVLQAFWPATLEEESVRMRIAEPAPPPARHAAEMSLRLSARNEDGLLRQSASLALALAPFLNGASEDRARGRLALLLPGLSWNWLSGEMNLSEDTVVWLRRTLEKNEAARAMLERETEAHGVRLAQELPRSAHDLSGLIVRARKLGLRVWFWQVQNMVMELPGRDVHAELCQLLGLAVRPG